MEYALVLMALAVLFLVRNEVVHKHRLRRIDECHANNARRIDNRKEPLKYDHERNAYVADVLDLRKWTYSDFYGDGSFKD